ncbi:MAG: hypothetical protein RR904_06690 [Bacilli bacterium]
MKSIVEQEKEIALKISSKLEYLITTKNIRASELARFVGVSSANFSRMRVRMKEGKFPTTPFLIGISKFFDENFLV